jgi:hypothetical protein
MKNWVPIVFFVGASLILYNVIPHEVTIILWLILIVLVINKWDIIKKNFS